MEVVAKKKKKCAKALHAPVKIYEYLYLVIIITIHIRAMELLSLFTLKRSSPDEYTQQLTCHCRVSLFFQIKILCNRK